MNKPHSSTLGGEKENPAYSIQRGVVYFLRVSIPPYCILSIILNIIHIYTTTHYYILTLKYNYN